MTPAQRLHLAADELALRGDAEAARSAREDAYAVERDEAYAAAPPSPRAIVTDGRVWTPQETARFLIREAGRSPLDAAVATGLTTQEARAALRTPPPPGTVGPLRAGTDPFIIP